MAEGCELPWGWGVWICHTDLNPFVEVGDGGMAVDPRDGGELYVKLHVPSNLGDLCGVLLSRGGEDKDLGMVAKDKFASARLDEVCPDCVHPGVL